MTMLNNQRLLNLMTVGLLLLGTVPTIAQPTSNPSTRQNRRLTRVLFKPPPDDPKPEQTRGAGSRHDGQCAGDATPTNLAKISSEGSSMVPLVPTTNTGLTIAERPTFFVYIPETSAKQVVLSIRENGTKHHSQTFVPITGESGIISLRPSPDSSPLEVGKAYQWAVVLVCGQRPNPNDPAIASWVRRVPLSATIKQGSALEQAAWYGEQGIWYDALTSLVQAKRSRRYPLRGEQPNNQDLTDIWIQFLESGGLNAIATKPLQL
ncbi:DUF928 domain-containing protein [Crocosphaera sp. XPORK-15E]|uniref:DUF928 domain-containing protein n=1 Tax=Crocosphaera sp. XPORK-15E TaxID=3110247 RepID=UPI002B20856A|nr:DUF928 domain-containing protein [Crocosphaera sp. XPORK-15E]MEA5537007.1 DUF928 domain-containing protein [Crocosphaera sp. XPORK-15E]